MCGKTTSNVIYILNYYRLLLRFIYFKRERVSVKEGGAGSEGERERSPSSKLSAQSPTWGSVSQSMRS